MNKPAEATQKYEASGRPEDEKEQRRVPERKTVRYSREAGNDYLNVDLVDQILGSQKLEKKNILTLLENDMRERFSVPRRMEFETVDGEKVGFEIGQVIGKGAQGIVAEGRPTDPEMKPAAIKIIFVPEGGDRRERALTEIAVASRINSDEEVRSIISQELKEAYKGIREVDNIDQFLAFKGAQRFDLSHMKSGGELYLIAYERGSGETLDNLLEAEPREYMDPDVAMVMMAQVMEGLLEMHKRGLVHRDVKPENLMGSINEPESVKIFDTGVSSDAFEKIQQAERTQMKAEAVWYQERIEDLIRMLKVVDVNTKKLVESAVKKFQEAQDAARYDEAHRALREIRDLYEKMIEQSGEEREEVPASVTDSFSEITLETIGSPLYMSKDALAGTTNDPLVDIYGAGATFARLTGATDLSYPDIQYNIPLLAFLKLKGQDFKDFDYDDPEFRERFSTPSRIEFAKLLERMMGKRPDSKIEQRGSFEVVARLRMIIAKREAEKAKEKAAALAT